MIMPHSIRARIGAGSPPLPILTFHALDEERAPISFPSRLFRRFLGELHEHGYETLSLDQVVDCLKRGDELPARALALTFDDGYQSVYTEAFPILKQFGLTATVFLAVGERRAIGAAGRLPSLEGRTMLSWGEIREMHQGGLTFGAHTLTHPDLTRVAPERAEEEICASKAIIEEALGASVTSFCYPYGRHNAQIRRLARPHFTCACTDRLALVTARSDPHALERLDAYYLRSERLFPLFFSRLLPAYIRLRRLPREIKRAFQ